ncbi:hypothetical protein ABPG75_013238 [Micractinium tetrahymenae]
MEPLGTSKPLRAACRPATRQRKRLQSCSDTESCASARPAPRKRTRRGPAAATPAEARTTPGSPLAAAPGTPAAAGLPSGASALCPYDLSLFVRWHGTCGRVRVNRLRLDPFSHIGELRGLSRRLVKGAFADAGALPDYLTCEEWYKFSPAEELISLPGDIARTEFRLVATLEGWEYTVCERTLPGTPDPDRRLLVTLAEFESDAVTVSDRQYVVRLLSYPTVCVKRAFLDDAVAALREGRAPGDGLSCSSAGGGEEEGEEEASAGSGGGQGGGEGCGEWDEGEEGQGRAPASAPASPSLSAA